jgi:hypothetical protein
MLQHWLPFNLDTSFGRASLLRQSPTNIHVGPEPSDAASQVENSTQAISSVQSPFIKTQQLPWLKPLPRGNHALRCVLWEKPIE